jgi:hypothetical protein
MKEAALYEKLTHNRVRCYLCAHRCVIADGKRGVCQVRENRGGAGHPAAAPMTCPRVARRGPLGSGGLSLCQASVHVSC